MPVIVLKVIILRGQEMWVVFFLGNIRTALLKSIAYRTSKLRTMEVKLINDLTKSYIFLGFLLLLTGSSLLHLPLVANVAREKTPK
jgi:hypothetical protein